MNSWLINISIGPVQSFIAAARKTRDLWFGSHLLSEISKSAALYIVNSGGKLILPGVEDDLNKAREQLKKGSPYIVGNKILAIVEPDLPIAEYLTNVKNTVNQYWIDQVNFVFTKMMQIGNQVIMKDVWDQQISDVVEFYAAWISFNGDDYATKKNRVEYILNGRKTLRDFKPNPIKRSGLPKSSLDGARDTVLYVKDNDQQKIMARFDITKGEQLDLVGVIKRVGGRNRKFPPIINIAVRPWLTNVLNGNDDNQLIQEIRNICVQEEIDQFDEPNYPHPNFKFEANVLYKNRLSALKKDGIFNNEASYQKLNNKLDGLYSAFKEPNSYIAVLLADGDGMGQFLNNHGNTVEKHQLISRILSEFSMEVGKIVKSHQGSLVYSGGDDVLAFVPIVHSINLAKELHLMFQQTMMKLTANSAFADLKSNTNQIPTLSVGIAWGHVMEPLRDLLDYAREAESLAKHPDKNALGVLLQTHSGGHKLSARVRWDAEISEGLSENVLNSLQKIIVDLTMDYLSTAVIHDLMAVRDRYGGGMDVSTLRKIVESELGVLINKKKPGSNNKEKISDAAKRLMDLYFHFTSSAQNADQFLKLFDDFINWMLLIRWLYQNTGNEFFVNRGTKGW